MGEVSQPPGKVVGSCNFKSQAVGGDRREVIQGYSPDGGQVPELGRQVCGFVQVLQLHPNFRQDADVSDLVFDVGFASHHDTI